MKKMHYTRYFTDGQARSTVSLIKILHKLKLKSVTSIQFKRTGMQNPGCAQEFWVTMS